MFSFRKMGTRASPADDDERRLVVAGAPVFLLIGLVFSHVATQEWLRQPPEGALRNAARSAGLYPVLVQQQFAVPKKKREISALSDVDAGGQGALTRKRGFNTISPDDVLDLRRGGSAGSGTPGARERTYRGAGDLPNRTEGRGGSGSAGGRLRIPANYRFLQEMRLNFGGGGQVSLPRRRFAEYSYFRAMLRQIRENWAPPGANVVYRDAYGYTAQQSIKPQVVPVLFLLDREGNVRDVRIVGPVIQRTVAESCVLALRGRNFGPPPEAVLKRGGIIGINFVFPPMRLR